ncbi:YceI family protein [Helicobacter fennelliae]|uniref:Lipid/polyisoprenoid-binding YceI-like domain-containing protein n=2 Tax=Helicobacter fennelliae TaxID=215 RepID=T1D0H8_9HELI|nr:YceI family protein [Helicobacter fennelliae]GAD18721.1 hypothetical protein HFN_2133 [Helicobacter fennelliae MRY12-0050]SQB97388.1 secreted protein [Helicobacter fennelliae]STP07110.1 secreted protein [Helicobacter fennelliae]STQ83342.1 secreted protein [Helicobacter fennelliae]
MPFDIDKKHSAISFSLTHLGISEQNGIFREFGGSLEIDTGTAHIKALEGWVEIASIDTNTKERDTNLQSEEFFSTKSFARAYFKAKEIKNGSVLADLTIKGITKEVFFDLKISQIIINQRTKKPTIDIMLTATINRKDFKIGEDVLNAVLNDKIALKIQLQATQKE